MCISRRFVEMCTRKSRVVWFDDLFSLSLSLVLVTEAHRRADAAIGPLPLLPVMTWFDRPTWVWTFETKRIKCSSRRQHRKNWLSVGHFRPLHHLGTGPSDFSDLGFRNCPVRLDCVKRIWRLPEPVGQVDAMAASGLVGFLSGIWNDLAKNGSTPEFDLVDEPFFDGSLETAHLLLIYARPSTCCLPKMHFLSNERELGRFGSRVWFAKKISSPPPNSGGGRGTGSPRKRGGCFSNGTGNAPSVLDCRVFSPSHRRGLVDCTCGLLLNKPVACVAVGTSFSPV